VTYTNGCSLIDRFPDGVITIDKTLVEGVGVPVSTLRNEGKLARKFGCSNQRVLITRIRTITGDERIFGLPDLPLKDSWRVDGIHQFSLVDQADRFNRGPRWSNNSCALDCVLFVLVALDAGRCMADQVWEHFPQRANDPARAVLTAIQKPWSILSSKDINRLRDKLQGELYKLDPLRHVIGKYQAASLVFDNLAACIPQFHATWGTVVRCCSEGSWQWQLVKKGSIKQVCSIGLVATIAQEARMQEAKDVESAVQLLLDPYPDDSTVTSKMIERCKRCTYSQNVPQRQKVVLDRPPPTLILKNFQTVASFGLKSGLFDDLGLNFRVCLAGGVDTIETRYVFWGCILLQGGNHFVVCFNRALRTRGVDFVIYDGMLRKGEVTQIVGSLEEFVRKGQYGMNMPLYVRVV
jgi:hypothetical protein